MRIAITGHKGQLGQALLETLTDDEVLGLDIPEHDITQAPEISDAIVEYRPEVVIHTAALTDVDRCAREPELALRINGLGTHNVALACQRCDAELLAVSTNEVFDGRLGRPYYEWDSPTPQSVYARSKAAGEFYVRALLHRFYIVRTAWLYARGGSNFVTKILAAADEHGALKVVTDETSAQPTPQILPRLSPSSSKPSTMASIISQTVAFARDTIGPARFWNCQAGDMFRLNPSPMKRGGGPPRRPSTHQS